MPHDVGARLALAEDKAATAAKIPCVTMQVIAVGNSDAVVAD